MGQDVIDSLAMKKEFFLKKRDTFFSKSDFIYYSTYIHTIFLPHLLLARAISTFWLLRYIPLLYAFLHTSNGFPRIDLSLSDGKTLLSPHEEKSNPTFKLSWVESGWVELSRVESGCTIFLDSDKISKIKLCIFNQLHRHDYLD